MPRLIVYRGQSRYDLLGLFADQLVDGLRAAGQAVSVVDFKTATLGSLQRELTTAPAPAAAISFNAIGADVLAEGIPLHARLGIPFVGLLVDHPLLHLSRLRVPLPAYQVTCVDHSHVDFLAQADVGGPPAAFLAHGACRPPGPGPGTRDIALLHAGSYEDPDSVAAQWRQASPATAALYDDVAAAALAAPEEPLGDVYRRVYRARGLPDELMTRDAALAAVNLIDRFVRQSRRRDFLLAFDRAGLAVDLFGVGWERFPAGRHRRHGEVSLRAMTEVMQRLKVVLAVGANFPAGSHERVLTAMICGAVAVTEQTRFYRESFSAGHELLTHDLVAPEAAVEPVRALLGDDERRRAIAAAGQRAVEAGHTWADRARQLVALLGARGISAAG